jgi:hypothetical protein
LFEVAEGPTVTFSQFLRFLRTCLVFSNRITYVTAANLWNKQSQGREVLEYDAMRIIIENLACACFGWPPQVSDSLQKFLDHLEERYVATPISSSDRQLHLSTQSRLIECLQKYDPHLRKAFLRAAKGKGEPVTGVSHIMSPPSNFSPTAHSHHILQSKSTLLCQIDSRLSQNCR